MLGYVTAKNSELKMKDFARYGGYYCGVCKSIGRRYGQLPRLVLSYDAAFLALLLSALSGEHEESGREHCIIHHIKKRPVISCDAVDYSADVMLILAWYKLDDDVRDEGRISSRAIMKTMHGVFKKLQQARPELERSVREGLLALSLCEQRRSPSLDEAGDAFGKVMSAVLTGYAPAAAYRRALERIGYHLGRWIYLMDAWEDIGENIESGAYNPLLLRFAHRPEESQEDFRKRIYNDVERNLMIYLEEMAKTIDLLDIKRNKDIIENIVYMGLLARTEQALGKENNEDE
ncbi:MAG: DUF5685 family protein [Anaerovoracaceae bacterium]|jgi:hypothetical protein